MGRTNLVQHAQEIFSRAEILSEVDRYLAQIETLQMQGSIGFRISYDSFGRFTGFTIIPAEQRVLPRRGAKGR